jgi:hypothetical protein
MVNRFSLHKHNGIIHHQSQHLLHNKAMLAHNTTFNSYQNIAFPNAAATLPVRRSFTS